MPTSATKRQWFVIANAARARVLEEADLPGRFRRVVDLVHPRSRVKGEELGGARPGHVEGIGHGLGSAAYLPRTDPREREHERFARELAATVNRAVAAGRCVGVTLVASDPFLGHVKAHLSVQSRKLLLRSVAHDYTALRDDEVARRLGAE